MGPKSTPIRPIAHADVLVVNGNPIDPWISERPIDDGRGAAALQAHPIAATLPAPVLYRNRSMSGRLISMSCQRAGDRRDRWLRRPHIRAGPAEQALIKTYERCRH
jgi:hypothetical protein